MIEPHLEAIKQSARHLDLIANLKLARGLGLDEDTRALLHRAYWAAFKACLMKGAVEKKRAFQQSGSPSAAALGQLQPDHATCASAGNWIPDPSLQREER
jgi:hypothetical protein